MLPLVSIVVTTKNEQKHIENCLLSIKEQTYPNIEIIVIDNHSTDKTKRIAKRFTGLVFDKGPERSAQRNYGMIDVANGKYVMFIDADMILSPCLIDACVSELEHGDLVALFISEIVLGNSYWCKVRRFERSFYDATVIDSARIYRRDVFCQVGGFDEKIDFGEEWDIDKEVKKYGRIGLLRKDIEKEISYDWKLADLINQLGINMPHNQNVIYHNESEFDLKGYIKKKSNYSKKFDKYINKWGKNDADLRKQFGLWYRYFGVFLQCSGWKRIIIHPSLTVGMYWLRFCVGIAFLRHKMGPFNMNTSHRCAP